ncbi:NlpC/P60 family protein [Xanthobacter sp. DSM 24535]|uniref:C40 family peptidase n=1 Tax=Roseixanthobacter psychrophilus TaxID=3119917 RepID=UPI003729D1DA
MSQDLKGRDPRLTPAKATLAAESLRGIVDAPFYNEGVKRRVVEPVAAVRRAPSSTAALDTEALQGEIVTIYEDEGEGWAWGQLEADGYVGYLPSESLAALGPAPTHKVRAQRTFLFPGPDIKLPPRAVLPFGGRVEVRDLRGALAVTPQGFLPAVHLVPVDHVEGDFVDVAARFLGTPYLWGGRSAFGLDCSGLVQTALAACGIAAPRDSDQQEAALGAAVPLDTPLRRGDLLFWPGHVAIVEDEANLLHANAFAMSVAREPLPAALARIGATTPLRSIKRLEG